MNFNVMVVDWKGALYDPCSDCFYDVWKKPKISHNTYKNANYN